MSGVKKWYIIIHGCCIYIDQVLELLVFYIYFLSFTVFNGVTQGEITSPILFNVIMNELSVVLNSTNEWTI